MQIDLTYIGKATMTVQNIVTNRETNWQTDKFKELRLYTTMLGPN